MARNVVLCGATGMVGNEVLRLLQGDPRFTKVTVLTRTPHPAIGKVEVHVVDLNRPETWAHRVTGDAAICCLGSTMARAGSREAFRAVDFSMVEAFARSARQGAVPHFLLVSALGASRKSRIFYMQVKGEAEEAVLSLGFPSVTIARPSLLTGERREKRFGEKIARTLAPVFDTLMLGPLEKYRSISAAQVARALVESAAEPASGLRALDGSAIAHFALGKKS